MTASTPVAGGAVPLATELASSDTIFVYTAAGTRRISIQGLANRVGEVTIDPDDIPALLDDQIEVIYADGRTTAYALPAVPQNTTWIKVFLDGVFQTPDTSFVFEAMASAPTGLGIKFLAQTGGDVPQSGQVITYTYPCTTRVEQAYRATYGGTANAITLTLGAGLSGTIPTGLELRFRATSANTGATTIALDGGSAISCRTMPNASGAGVALPADYIRTDVDTIARYDGTYWVLGREAETGTSGGYRYERLANGVQRCWGSVSITPSAANIATGTSVTFPKAFSAPPTGFTTQAVTSSPGTAVTGTSVSGPVATAVTVNLTRTDTNTTTVHWSATGEWF